MDEKDKPDLVFVIRKLKIDETVPLDESPIKYLALGFVYDEEKAERICREGKTYTSEDSWAVEYPIPEFIYESVRKLEP